MMILMVIPLSSLRCADWLIGTVPRSLGRQNSQPGPESLVLMTCRLAVGALGVVWNKDPIMMQSALFWARWNIFRGSGLCWTGCWSSDASEGWGSRRRVLSVRRDLGSLFPPPLSPEHPQYQGLQARTRLNGCVHCLREMGLANRDQPVALTIQLISSARFPFFAFLRALSKKVQSLYIMSLLLDVA